MTKRNKKKRSFAAELISFIGSIVMVLGLCLILFEIFIIATTDNGSAGLIILGFLLLILSIIIQYSSIQCDKYIEHRKWVKRLYSAGIVDELPYSGELAWRAYQTNPTPMGLNFIEEHNPNAAADIRKHISENTPLPIDKLTNSVFSKYANKSSSAKTEHISEKSTNTDTEFQDKTTDIAFSESKSNRISKVLSNLINQLHTAAAHILQFFKSLLSKLSSLKSINTTTSTEATDDISECTNNDTSDE